jgi:hypothetical protein
MDRQDIINLARKRFANALKAWPTEFEEILIMFAEEVAERTLAAADWPEIIEGAYPTMIRAWAKRTIPELAFSASDAELENLAELIVAYEREQCALVCEKAGMDGYGTLAAAEAIRRRGDCDA